ncbi:MAG: hypothetical protein R6V05_13725 [Candidatus Brocadiia bacterium]
MIPPVLVIVRVGRLLIPVPAILLWPLLLLLLVVGPMVLPFVRMESTSRAQRAMLPLHLCRLLGSLRGLRVDIETSSGEKVHVSCH